METQQKSLEGLFEEATPDQRQQILMLLKEKAGYPTARKRQSGSHNEADGRPSWMPHKTCDNCSLSQYEQDPNNPTVLVQGCPYYPMRQYEENVGRLVCLKWANRRFATCEEDEDGDGVEKG